MINRNDVIKMIESLDLEKIKSREDMLVRVECQVFNTGRNVTGSEIQTWINGVAAFAHSVGGILYDINAVPLVAADYQRVLMIAKHSLPNPLCNANPKRPNMGVPRDDCAHFRFVMSDDAIDNIEDKVCACGGYWLNGEHYGKNTDVNTCQLASDEENGLLEATPLDGPCFVCGGEWLTGNHYEKGEIEQANTALLPGATDEMNKLIMEDKLNGVYDNPEIYKNIDSPFYGILPDLMRTVACWNCHGMKRNIEGMACKVCCGEGVLPMMSIEIVNTWREEHSGWLEHNRPQWGIDDIYHHLQTEYARGNTEEISDTARSYARKKMEIK